MCTKKVVAVVGSILALALASAGCGGGGGGGGDGEVQGFRFTQADMSEAAGVGAAMTEIFPGVTEVTMMVLGSIIEGPPPARQAALVVPIGDLGLCVTGTAELTWDDRDNDAALSSGDAATLAFTDCDMDDEGTLTSGTASFSFTSVELPTAVIALVTLDITSEGTLDGAPATEGFSGSFRLALATADGATFTATFGAPNRSDVVRFSLNGEVLGQFGCFDVVQTFSRESPEAYTLAPRGIGNVGGQILQLGSYWGPDVPLSFQPGFGPEPVPTSGTLTYLSFDGRPNTPPSFGELSACTVVGSPGEVDTDNSSLLLTATGGENILLEVFNNLDLVPPPIAQVNTTWSALMD
ncbi:MAG: hypothetical protein AB1578_16355 [Thermodesulfobacteriota bacterium]